MTWLIRHKQILIILLIVAAFLYGVDDLSSRFGLPPRPRFATVTIRRYFFINEKYNKFSYDPLPSVDERCVNALFPHSGSRPCWYVRKHTIEVIPVN